MSDELEPPKYGWYKKGGRMTYDPSPEEIRKKCEEIQATWSPRERYQRAAWAFTGRVCGVHTADGLEINEV